jgi:hypothetical protein
MKQIQTTKGVHCKLLLIKKVILHLNSVKEQTNEQHVTSTYPTCTNSGTGGTCTMQVNK